MSLIIETGQIINGANSYTTLAAAQAFVQARALPSTLTEALLLQGMDALAGVTWRGQPARLDQPLDWPRQSVYDRYGQLVPVDVVPAKIIQAQIWLAHAIEQGNDPAARTGPGIRSESVGPISTTYALRMGERDTVTLYSLPNVRHALADYWQHAGNLDRA